MVTGNLKPNLTWVPEVKEEFQENFIGYFDSTTVHGLRYLTERRRPWPERVLWFVGVSVGLVACVCLMNKTYKRWVESPVIMAMDETQRAVWQIPFPAVTICPSAKVRKEFLDFNRFAQLYKEGKLSPEQIDLLAKVQLPCDIQVVLNDTFKNESAIDVVEAHALKKEDVIVNKEGLFHASLQLNEADFQPIMTEVGLCFSFNMLPGHMLFRENTFHASRPQEKYLEYKENVVQWSPVEGYARDADSVAYPFRAMGPGKRQGLQVFLQTKTKELRSLCSILGQGFKVFLHSPIEFPRAALHATSVPLGSVVQMVLTPHEFRTSDKLRHSYSARQRQCYFPDERPLRFFRFYTQSNCQLECLTNRTMRDCRCVKFYMPRAENTSICGQEQELCTRRAEGRLHEEDADDEELDEGEHSLNRGDAPCDCLSTCATVWYDNTMSQTAVDPAYVEYLNITQEPVNITTLEIYYTDLQFLPTRRVEVFGTSDLLASLGGIMGLCMGISLLSVIELFYWMLIRPCCQRIKQRNPELRSVRKPEKRTRVAEAGVQYSRHEDELAARAQADAAV